MFFFNYIIGFASVQQQQQQQQQRCTNSNNNSSRQITINIFYLSYFNASR